VLCAFDLIELDGDDLRPLPNDAMLQMSEQAGGQTY
jgi:hypothetical protein